MATSRIKSKVVKSTIENKDVISMFQGVLGTGENTSLDLKVVHPKYVRIRAECNRFLRLLGALARSALMASFPAARAHLEDYAAGLGDDFAGAFTAPDLLAEYPATSSNEVERALLRGTVDFQSVSRESYESFTDVYSKIKECNLVKTIVVTCKNMTSHRRAIGDAGDLCDRFLTKTAGMTFAPLPGLGALNIKHIYIQDFLGKTDREYLLLFLHKLYSVSHEVYEAVSSPDIDVDDFVGVIMSSLGDVKKQIPRCDEAFSKIGDSVDLLKGNFTGYYKDYVESDNPTVIMENFVLDVSKNTKSSPKITAQFRRIIGHYRKIAAQRAIDPRLNSLFAKVDDNFKELSKSGGADDLGEEVAEDEAEDGAGAGAGAAPPADEAKDLSPAECAKAAKTRRNRKKRDGRKKREGRARLEADFAAAQSAELPRCSAASSGSLADEFSGRPFAAAPPPVSGPSPASVGAASSSLADEFAAEPAPPIRAGPPPASEPPAAASPGPLS